MKVDFHLTAEQQVLVINHMNVVEGVVKYSINVNENICGLGYDDLFQEGCLWLCRAAVTPCVLECWSHFPRGQLLS